jgi:methylenetetrahydrofolate dehydrogenase (NADP+)/methenyltetrahydrofolate cyclohydrolase
MGATIIDGKATAAEIRGELSERVAAIARSGTAPGLAVVLVGENPASVSYVTAKERDCASIGITSFDIRIPVHTTEDELIDLIEDLNTRVDVDGILVQLPLPDHVDEQRVIRTISPEKDVDGFHPLSLGRLLLGLPSFLPCTPNGIIQLLIRHGIETAGRHAVVIGRSNIVGKPLSILLARKAEHANATVTICHSRTRDIGAITRTADILVAAIGVPRFVTADMVAEGAVVIDVGVNRVEDAAAKRGYRLVGDVDFDTVAERAGAITPVPGGVGPMTRAMLLFNTVESAERRRAST